nr:IucA/IucC family protein [uncultured Flavobacterium sp.]
MNIERAPHLEVFSSHVWEKVNLNLLAKSLAELMHEDVAKPTITGSEKDGIKHFKLTTDLPEVYYTFSAYPRLLEYWHIEKQSIQRWENNVAKSATDGLCFFMEMQQSFGIDSFTLAHYIEELLNTLYADAHLYTRDKISVQDLVNSDYQVVEHQMEGHPWVIANKGRVGFNNSDYHNYAPEADKDTVLYWLAAHKKRAVFNALETISFNDFYQQELGQEVFKRFQEKLRTMKLVVEDYVFIPVHPWQLNNKLLSQFHQDLANQYLVILEKSEDIYSPQQSIRTFFNVSCPAKHYVKTAISILSTGNIRGLSPKQMDIAPRVTKWVKEMLEDDSYFKEKEVVLLGEVATVSYRHPQYSAITDSPYHYREMLGALWRESAEKYRKPEEKLMTMAALLYVDNDNCPFLQELINASGLSTQDWLKKYLEVYLKPLLHIYYQHSLCVTPHGENIILVMKNGLPQRIIIKDFVDDIVLTEEARTKLPAELKDGLIQSSNKENTPLFILIGVFDAFFRYLSDILHTYMDYDEHLFWKTVTEAIEEYQQDNQHLTDRFEKYNLFEPEFKRFYINSLKLLNNGYAEQTGFAVPKKGSKLPNPLYVIKQYEMKEFIELSETTQN